MMLRSRFFGLLFCLFVLIQCMVPVQTTLGIPSIVEDNTFFSSLRVGEPTDVIFHVKNISNRPSTINARFISKNFPDDDEKNWQVKFCYSGLCFFDEAESTTEIAPGESIEFRFGIYPKENAKMQELVTVVFEIYLKKAPAYKERITHYSVCVPPKKIQFTIGEKVATINDQSIALDATPFIKSGRTLVPLRFIGEIFGADIEWEGKSQKIHFQLSALECDFWIGNTNVLKKIGPNFSKKFNIDVAPLIKNNRTFVPVRVITDLFGGEVLYDLKTKTITIYFPPRPILGGR